MVQTFADNIRRRTDTWPTPNPTPSAAKSVPVSSLTEPPEPSPLRPDYWQMESCAHHFNRYAYCHTSRDYEADWFEKWFTESERMRIWDHRVEIVQEGDYVGPGGDWYGNTSSYTYYKYIIELDDSFNNVLKSK